MVILLAYWLLGPISILLCLLGILYIYFSNVYQYWEKRGVPYIMPTFLFGNLKENFLQRKHTSHLFQDFYNEAKDRKIVGIYEMWKPSLVVMDLEVIRRIMVKDFDHFQDHNFDIHEEFDPLNAKTLMTLKGEKWRYLRMKLTPTFTSGKIKKMLPLILECAEGLNRCLMHPAKNKEVLEVKDILAKFTTDVIASCAFGIKCNCLVDPNAEFRQVGKRLTDPPGFVRAVKLFILLFLPALNKWLRFPFVSSADADFFRSILRDAMEHRERHKIIRHDFVDLLLQLKNKGYVEDEEGEHAKVPTGVGATKQELSHDVLTAQAYIFFIGGFETSSNTMSNALYELSLNQEIQSKLREEMDAVVKRYGGEVTYEGVQEMTYLDKVVQETLRKYPPLAILSRRCTKEYKLPASDDVTIEKGTDVHIPIYAIQHDPRYYPNPDVFDPERFSEASRKQRPNYTHMPFGEGPRHCIGNRFGLLQTKVGLITALIHYQFTVCSKTRIPFIFDPGNFFLQAKDGIWLQISERTR